MSVDPTLTPQAALENVRLARALVEPIVTQAARGELIEGGVDGWITPALTDYIGTAVDGLGAAAAELEDVDEDGGALGPDSTFDPRTLQ